MNRLEGRVVLVTGSGRGFGRSMAIAYAIEGAKVIGVSRTKKELDGMAAAAKSRGGEVLTIPMDLTNDNDIHILKDKIFDAYGGLDVLVNNAAASPWKLFEETTIKDWDRTISVNLRTIFILTKTFFESMKSRGRGSIINITSPSAERGHIAGVAYCTSKFGLEGLTQCLALELKNYNIAVNSLNVSAPQGSSLKPTGLTLAQAGKMPEDIREKYANDDSMVDAFKDAWVFLALQDASGVTGQRIRTQVLAESLQKNGWKATVANWKGKLTKAVYQTYDFPRSQRYQTPEGGHKDFKFE